MANAPYNINDDQTIQSDVVGLGVARGFIAQFQVPAASAVAASTTGVKTAVTSNGTTQTITTGITNPAVPRVLTATAGGTSTDIKAIQVVITGTNYNGDVITETLPAFTVDTAGTVTGTKAFKTVTQIVIPAHDGNGATTAVGFSEILGLPFKLQHNGHMASYLNNVREATAPTVAFSLTNLENNTIKLNSSLNGSSVESHMVV
jgi:hypothetical protein